MQGLGFGVWGFCFLVFGLGFRVQDSAFMVEERDLESSGGVFEEGKDDHSVSASERRENSLKGSEGLLPESQGQNLALTVLYVPSLFDSGMCRRQWQVQTRERRSV